ncbi:MAG: sigma-70 family RNA polymerase sigma factor, partial [Bacteroidales bacterium]|nr:sigma-70 family RNA polymerase sigma factor [Bacteroidales bacterium]
SQGLLYKRFFGYALSIAMIYNNSREDALEIVNDGFMKVFSEIEKYDRSQPFKGWLRKIVINTSIDRLRKKRSQYLSLDHESEVLQMRDGNADAVSNLTAQDVLKLLNKLSDAQRVVFCLFEIEGFSHFEIAGQLHIPESSSRVLLTRAKKQLRELFPLYFNTEL